MISNKNDYAAIISRINAGDENAFTDLYEATKTKVYYTVQKSMRTTATEDVADLVQEVYIAAFKNIASLRQPEKAVSWLCGIAANLCRHQLGRAYNDGNVVYIDDDEQYIELAGDISCSPEYVADRKATNEIILSMVDALPAAQRITVILFYFDEMSIAEIAVAMDCSENTVKSRLNYARRSIEAAVLKQERAGIKLYSVSGAAILHALSSECAKMTIQEKIIGGSIAAITGNAAETAANCAGIGLADTIATAVVVKTTGVGIGAKIVAGIVAGTILVGGAVTGNKLIKSKNEKAENIIIEAPRDEEEPYLQFVDTITNMEGSSAFVTDNGDLMCCGEINKMSIPTLTAVDVRCVSGSMFVKNDSTLWSIGESAVGDLGREGIRDHYGNLKLADDVKAVFCGGGLENAVMLKNDGTLWSWGLKPIMYSGFVATSESDMGWTGNALGNGTNTYSGTPEKILDDVKTASVDVSGGLAVKNDGSLWGWGASAGVRGNYINDYSVLSPEKLMDNVTDAAIGNGFSLALTDDGCLWLWNGGQYDDKTLVAEDVIAFSAGLSAMSFVKSDHSLWIYGKFYCLRKDCPDAPEKLMDNVETAYMFSRAVLSSTSGAWPENHFIIKATDGSIWTCGYNSSGQIGNGKKYSDYSNSSDEFISRGYETEPVRIYSPYTAELEGDKLSNGSHVVRLGKNAFQRVKNGWTVSVDTLTYDSYSKEEILQWEVGSLVSFKGIKRQIVEMNDSAGILFADGENAIIRKQVDGDKWYAGDESGAACYYVNGNKELFISDDAVFYDYYDKNGLVLVGGSVSCTNILTLEELFRMEWYEYRDLLIIVENGKIIEVTAMYHP